MRIVLLIGVFVFAALGWGPVSPAATGRQGNYATDAEERRCPGATELDALLGNAGAMMEQGRFRETVELVQPLSASYCDYRISLLLAAAFEGSGDVPAAERALQRAHSIWPSNTSIATSLARYYLEDREIEKARLAVAQCRVSSSTPLRELQMVGMVYLESHDLTRARSVAAFAYKQYPSEETLLFAANVLQLQGRFKDVVLLLQKNRNSYAGSSAFLITLAESEYDDMMYGPAQTDLMHAVAFSPGSYPAHYLLGNVLVKTGSLDRAIAEYQTAIRLSPQEPRTYYRLALALEAKGDTSGARRSLQQAIGVDNDYGPAYCEIGKMLMQENRTQEAAYNLARAIQYDPSLDDAYYLLVQAYARMGEKSKSAALLKHWLALKSANKLRRVHFNAENPLGDATEDQYAGPNK